METMISWANMSLPLPRDHLVGSRTWRLFLWLPCCASVQWRGAQQEQGQHAYSCLLLEDLSWKGDMDYSSPHNAATSTEGAMYTVLFAALLPARTGLVPAICLSFSICFSINGLDI